MLNGPMDVPGGDRIAQCMDPQGAAFAVHSKEPDPRPRSPTLPDNTAEEPWFAAGFRVDDGSADWRNRYKPSGVGLRSADQRRHDERRHSTRKGRERRKGDRRRAGMRTLLLTAAALSAPHAAKVKAAHPFPTHGSSITNSRPGLLPSVSVNIDSIVAPESAHHAYDHIIAEAAEKYDLDPRMIRSVMQRRVRVQRDGGFAGRRAGPDAVDAGRRRRAWRRRPDGSASEHHGRLASPASSC